MRSAPQLLHVAAGAPQEDDCALVPERFHCWVCGGDGCDRGMPRDVCIGESYTDQNKAKAWDSQWACEACMYFRRRSNKPPGLSGNWRNYSALYEGGTYVCLSKGEKPAIREWLRREHKAPWFAALAESGQKHVILWAPLNLDTRPGKGRVLFEEQLLELGDWALLDEITELLTAGVTKEEFESGSYSVRSWQTLRPRLEAFMERWQTLHGGAWWSLCVYLAQRDEAAVAARLEVEKAEREAKKKAAAAAAAEAKRKGKKNAERTVEEATGRPAGGRRARAPKGVPEDAASERPEALGPVAKPAADRSEDERGPTGNVVPDSPPAVPAKPERKQLTLF